MWRLDDGTNSGRLFSCFWALLARNMSRRNKMRGYRKASVSMRNGRKIGKSCFWVARMIHVWRCLDIEKCIISRHDDLTVCAWTQRSPRKCPDFLIVTMKSYGRSYACRWSGDYTYYALWGWLLGGGIWAYEWLRGTRLSMPGCSLSHVRSPRELERGGLILSHRVTNVSLFNNDVKNILFIYIRYKNE